MMKARATVDRITALHRDIAEHLFFLRQFQDEDFFMDFRSGQILSSQKISAEIAQFLFKGLKVFMMLWKKIMSLEKWGILDSDGLATPHMRFNFDFHKKFPQFRIFLSVTLGWLCPIRQC